jgi:calcineurin-like phosphoesterase family protein
MWFERDGIKFYLAHDPAIYTVIQNDPNTVLLCGHVHQLFQHLLPDKRVINVGVDAWNFKPVSYNTILNLLKRYNIG